MKTITKTFNIYKFEELNEEQQSKVLDNLYDINIDYDWWEFIYDDASENAGLKITGFDIDRGQYCNIEFINNAKETAEKIIKNFGNACEEYGYAVGFLAGYDNIQNELEDNDLETFEQEFLNILSKSYLKDLKKDYEYRTNKDAIIKTIKCNDYNFTEDGKIYS